MQLCLQRGKPSHQVKFERILLQLQLRRMPRLPALCAMCLGYASKCLIPARHFMFDRDYPLLTHRTCHDFGRATRPEVLLHSRI